MITYVTYREATVPSMAALGAAREQAEAAGWFVCTVKRQGAGATVLFGFEDEVDSTGNHARPELPEFRRVERAPGTARSLVAAARSRVGLHLRRRRARTPLVPQVRPSVPQRH